MRLRSIAAGLAAMMFAVPAVAQDILDFLPYGYHGRTEGQYKCWEWLESPDDPRSKLHLLAYVIETLKEDGAPRYLLIAENSDDLREGNSTTWVSEWVDDFCAANPDYWIDLVLVNLGSGLGLYYRPYDPRQP